MKRTLINVFSVWVFVLAFTAAALAGQLEIRLKDGSKWRGDVSDTVQVRHRQHGVEVPLEGKLLKIENLYIVVEGVVAGVTKQVTVFKSDIVSMSTISHGDGAAPAASATNGTTNANPARADSPPTGVSASTGSQPGVFMLPLDGGVGIEFRHQEIKKLGEFIDKNYGPGQIIVLRINTDGGLSYETQKIGNEIRELRKRHRVVAWIEKAISAGCQTAMYCNEIYFMTQGTAGSVTTWSGNLQAVRGPELERILEDFVRIAEENGYSKFIALSMKMNEYECSYDKDPETGVVTFYGDLSGKYKLSDNKSNLCFTASNALHCGFSKGTADTEEELAKLLNLPKWHEVSDYGRKIAKDWQKTAKEAQERLPILAAQFGYKNTSTGDAVVILGTRIALLNELIGWWTRAPNICEMSGIPPKDVLEREVAELKRQIAGMKGR